MSTGSRNLRRLDAVRRFNKRYFNPLMLHLAGKRHWYAARLEHTGRRSHRAYVTPVVAQPLSGGEIAIPLPYGADVDWCRNVQAAGEAVLRLRGREFRVSAPRVVPLRELWQELPLSRRAAARLFRIDQWLLLHAEPVLRKA